MSCSHLIIAHTACVPHSAIRTIVIVLPLPSTDMILAPCLIETMTNRSWALSYSIVLICRSDTWQPRLLDVHLRHKAHRTHIGVTFYRLLGNEAEMVAGPFVFMCHVCSSGTIRQSLIPRQPSKISNLETKSIVLMCPVQDTDRGKTWEGCSCVVSYQHKRPAVIHDNQCSSTALPVKFLNLKNMIEHDRILTSSVSDCSCTEQYTAAEKLSPCLVCTKSSIKCRVLCVVLPILQIAQPYIHFGQFHTSQFNSSSNVWCQGRT